MTFADLSPLANHLWQSTLFAAIAWLLTLALRKNRAAVRYWLWLAASVKFLIPFSLLVSAGAQLEWRTVPIIAPPQLSSALVGIAQPFAAQAPAPLPAVAAPVLNPLPAILFAVWLCGIAIGIVFWLRWWWQVRSMQRAATPLGLNLPVKVMSSPTRREPGVFGIRKPCLLLPEGIADRLTPLQLEAILAHELRHVQRRDNLTAAIHMLVETIFWFHPLVWWIRVRLVEERELACDEGVLRLGSEPQVYAESILKVCEFYLASPVACAAGVSGGELKKRIEGIMNAPLLNSLSFGKKLMVGALGTLALATPITVGILRASASHARSPVALAAPPPPASPVENTQQPRMLAQKAPTTLSNPPEAKGQPEPAHSALTASGQAAAPAPAFEVASVKRTDLCGGGRSIDPRSVTLRGVPLKPVLMEAFKVRFDQIEGPSWLETDCFDISAKIPDGGSLDQLSAMLQALLTERFKLAAHKEDRPRSGYALVVDKGGPKFKEDDPKTNFMGRDARPGQTMYGAFGHGALKGVMTMAKLVANLSTQGYGPVQDLTGLTGNYDIDLRWTPNPDLGPRGADATVSAATPPGADIPAPEPDLFTALRESLGLKLERRDVQMQFVVIDHIERIPTEN